MVHLRNVANVTAKYCRTIGTGKTLFEAEENTSINIDVSDNTLQPGQSDIEYVPALPDEQLFEDFRTEMKFSVDQGDVINGLYCQDLDVSPLEFSILINRRGSLQMCLLVLNDSPVPEKILVKYEGIVQEFTVNWDEWGWAPVTLLKEYPEDMNVNFEIAPSSQDTGLKIAKVYFRYQDVGRTD